MHPNVRAIRHGVRVVATLSQRIKQHAGGSHPIVDAKNAPHRKLGTLTENSTARGSGSSEFALLMSGRRFGNHSMGAIHDGVTPGRARHYRNSLPSI